MFQIASLALAVLLASSSVLVQADVKPLTPAPGDIFNEGATCHIAWAPDTTGLWKTLNIELMTGDNTDMIHLTTVATVDGTSTSSFDYTCPAVTPNSAIYFYQFTSPNSTSRFWTGRFAIADTTGQTVPPTNSTQPDNSPIPWGIGALVDPSTAVPPPPYLTNTSTTSIPPTGSTILSSSVATTSSILSNSTSIVVTPTSNTLTTSAASAAATTTGAPAASAATSGLVINYSVWQSVVTLGATAFAFAIFF